VQGIADTIVMPASTFLIDEKRQALLKGQIKVLRVVLLFLQALPEGRQAQFDQFVQ